jgi:hypothetical protein
MMKKGEETKEVISYGIASVYTPAHQRGKGYARQILQLVHYLIAPSNLLPPFPETWGPKPDIGPMNADFSILFSGIGEKYYATCRQGEGQSSKAGWIRQPITSRTWDISQYKSGTGLQDRWEWLGPDQLEVLESEGEAAMRDEIAGSRTGAAGTSFMVLPSW